MPDQHTEDEVTLDSLDKALEALVDASDAADVIAKGGLDSGGHVDERGQTSGGYPGKGDMGGIDDMMIGKMQETLVDAGFSADMISAFMSKKDEDEDEDEKGGEGDDAGEDDAEKSQQAAADAIEKSFRDDPSIREAIDVSPFLESLVTNTVEEIQGLAKSLHEGQATQAHVNKAVASTLHGIAGLVKGLQGHSQRLEERLGMVERQPAAPKGHTSLSGAQPVLKSFGAHGTEGGGGQVEQLTKSELTNVLTYMNLEKSIKEIGGTKTSEHAGIIEGGGHVHPAAYHAAMRFLASHPHEAATARTYR